MRFIHKSWLSKLNRAPHRVTGSLRLYCIQFLEWLRYSKKSISFTVQFSVGMFAWLQQLQSAQSDLDDQTKLVSTLQDALDASQRGQVSEKEVN